jgi:hypothetical protein
MSDLLGTRAIERKGIKHTSLAVAHRQISSMRALRIALFRKSH